jgi:hypothetical protein
MSINKFVMRYIHRYIYGFILKNHSTLAFRDSYATIEVKNNELIIIMKRTKKRILPNVSNAVRNGMNTLEYNGIRGYKIEDYDV